MPARTRGPSALVLLVFALALISLAQSADRTPAPATPPRHGVTFPAKVVRVVDGDTVEVEIRRVVSVRIKDCWAPEVRTRDLQEKAKGLAAKEHMITFAGGQDVTVFVPLAPGKKVGDAFSFGRALGHIWITRDGKSLAEEMINAGHATSTKSP